MDFEKYELIMENTKLRKENEYLRNKYCKYNTQSLQEDNKNYYIYIDTKSN